MDAPLQVITPANGLSSWTIDLTWDSTALQLATCNPAPGSNCRPGSGANSIEISGSASPSLTGTQTLATLTFMAARTPSAARATPLNSVVEPFSLLQVMVGSFKDGSGTETTPTINGGAVVVAAPGDANADGTMNAVDALCVLRSVAGLSGTQACPVISLMLPSPGNVNNDGVVNAVDALCILRSVAGLRGTASCPVITIAAVGANRLPGAGGGVTAPAPAGGRDLPVPAGAPQARRLK